MLDKLKYIRMKSGGKDMKKILFAHQNVYLLLKQEDWQTL